MRALAWESVSPCLPLRGRWQRVALTEGAISHGNSSPPVACAGSPLPAGALQRGAAALTERRTPRAFVPLRSTAGCRPLWAVQRTCPVGRLALRPPFIRAGVSSRAVEQSIPPVMQCAHLPFRRKQGSSHPLTCHGMVPQASRTHFSGITKPRDFRRGVSCWRYLSSQAVSSQVLSAEASLTDLSRDGAAGIPNSLFRHNKAPRLSSRGFVLALPIFPGRLQPSIVSRSELN